MSETSTMTGSFTESRESDSKAVPLTAKQARLLYYTFICVLFNYIVSSSEYIALDNKMINE
jgi:hypothetical protein